MALFGKKDAKKEVAVVAKVVKEKSPVQSAAASVSLVIVKPRVTEKAAVLGEKNVYTFEVKKGATKYDVRDAIKALYNVTPVKVNIVNKVPRKTMSRARGRKVTEHGLRKAYVFLKEGDRIELV